MKNLLTTKIQIPPLRSSLVHRPRLTKFIHEGIKRKLTLISASAGFGKTTLISEWASNARWPIAWVSLDEYDNDPKHFLTYVIAALNVIEPHLGEAALAMLDAPQWVSMESILITLLNEIATISSMCILVLDDYHTINAKEVHDCVTFFVDHAPRNMHLILVTRKDPPLSLASLRGSDELIELRTRELQFTLSESTDFLNRMMQLGLKTDEITKLEMCTEGWVTGLQLAAFSIRKHGNIRSLLQDMAGHHRDIHDYLADEIFTQQPQNIREFLLKTSILTRLTGELCDSVMEQNDSQKILEYLEKENLFIISLDTKRHWYRYHHAFVEFLQHRLHQTQSNQLSQLHRRAAQWYETRGFISEAIDLLLFIGDFEQAASLIEQTGRTVWMRSEVTKLLKWLDTLPDLLVASKVKLCLFHAWALIITGNLESAESRLRKVELLLRVHQDNNSSKKLPHPLISMFKTRVRNRHVRGEVAAVRAYIARIREDIPRTIELSNKALENSAKDDLVLRSNVTLNMAFAYRLNGNLAKASKACVETSAMSQKVSNIYVTLLSIGMLTELQIEQGRLLQAARTAQQALRIAEEQRGDRLPVTGTAYVSLGELAYEKNDLDDAKRNLLEGIERAEQGGDTGILIDGYIALSRVKCAEGATDEALTTLLKAEEMAQRFNAARIIAPITAYKTWFSYLYGDKQVAKDWIRERGLGPTDEPTYSNEIEYLMLARVFVIEGRAHEVLSLLERLLDITENSGRANRMIQVLILLAVAEHTLDNEIKATGYLERALILAEPEGYVRVFIDEGRSVAMLLSKIFEKGRRRQRRVSVNIILYVSRLLTAFRNDPAGSKMKTAIISDPPRHSQKLLSRRELDVLKLVALGLSNEEIAERLFIAKGTVKKHLDNIFDKLDAHNRTQAVMRAREISLIAR